MYDEEIEKAVLFYMIFEKENFALDEKDFVNVRNKKVITAINALKAEKSEISLINIVNKINGNNKQILEYLSSLNEYIFGSSAMTSYNKLIEYSKKRQLYELIAKMEKEIPEAGSETADVTIAKIVKDLNTIQQRNEKVMTFEEQVLKAMQDIEKNYNKKSDYSLYTGLIDLDKMMLGLHNQELTVIGARPRCGKNNISITNCRTHC